MADLCKHGKLEHVTCEAGDRPHGCVCDWESWIRGTKLHTIPDQCDRYKPDSDGVCMTCFHDKACHKGKD